MKNKSKEITELLEQSKDYIDQNMEEFIKVLPKLKNYSARNKMLIFKQNPKVGIVKSFNEWNKDNFKVKKGSKALQIFIPTNKILYEFENKISKEKVKTYNKSKIDFDKFKLIGEEKKQSFVLRRVLFDQSQIENYEDVSQNEIIKNYNNNELVNKSIQLCENNNINLKLTNTLESNTYGSAYFFEDRKKTIKVKEGIDTNDYLRVFFHEMAHIKCEHDKKVFSDKEKELQAETISYLVCNELGVGNRGSTLSYLNNYQTDLDLEQFINIVCNVSETILGEIKDLEKLNENAKEKEDENE